MPARHLRLAPPRIWLLTDARQGAALWPALAALPRGAGVVVRHYEFDRAARAELIARVRRIARRRGLVLAVAGEARAALRAGAEAVYQPRRPAPPQARPLLRLASAHGRAELVAAARARADLVLLSPAFPTRSHPGARTLGPRRFGLLARESAVKVIALGGMTPARARRLAPLGAYGWAAIDGFVRI